MPTFTVASLAHCCSLRSGHITPCQTPDRYVSTGLTAWTSPFPPPYHTRDVFWLFPVRSLCNKPVVPYHNKKKIQHKKRMTILIVSHLWRRAVSCDFSRLMLSGRSSLSTTPLTNRIHSGKRSGQFDSISTWSRNSRAQQRSYVSRAPL